MAYFLHILFHLLSQGLLTPWANEHLDFTNVNPAEVFSTTSPTPDLFLTGRIGDFSSGNRSDAGSALFPSSGDLNDQNVHSICLSMFNQCDETLIMNDLCGIQNDLLSCDTRCLVYDDCSPGFRTACPDIYEEALLFNASLPPHGEAKCLSDLGALVIADCPPSADVSTTLQDKCREGVKVHDEEFIPVTDAYSALYYSNTFCALCNSVHSEDMIPWLQIAHIDVNALSLQEKDVDISELEGVHFIFSHALGNGILGNDWVSWQFIPSLVKPRRCVSQEIPSSCDSDLTPSPSRFKHALELLMLWKRSHDNLKLVELTIRGEPEPVTWERLLCRVEGASLTDCRIRHCGKSKRLRRGRCELMPIVRDFAVWVRLPPPAFFVELSDSDRRQLQSSSSINSSSIGSSNINGSSCCSSMSSNSSNSSSSSSSRTKNNRSSGSSRSTRTSSLNDIFKDKIDKDWTEEASRELSSRALEVIQDAVRTSFYDVTILRAFISKNVPRRWSARIMVRFAFPWSPREPSYQPSVKECQLSSLRNMKRLLENSVALSKVLLCFNFGQKLRSVRRCKGGVYLAGDPTQGTAFSKERKTQVLKEVESSENGVLTIHRSGLKLLLAFTACINALVVLIL